MREVDDAILAHQLTVIPDKPRDFAGEFICSDNEFAVFDKIEIARIVSATGVAPDEFEIAVFLDFPADQRVFAAVARDDEAAIRRIAQCLSGVDSRVVRRQCRVALADCKQPVFVIQIDKLSE